MNCQYRYYKSGLPNFSDRLPGYAQGYSLPGEEAGHYCHKDGLHCYLENHDNEPDLCPIQEELQDKCPFCGANMFKNGNGEIYCQNHKEH